MYVYKHCALCQCSLVAMQTHLISKCSIIYSQEIRPIYKLVHPVWNGAFGKRWIVMHYLLDMERACLTSVFNQVRWFLGSLLLILSARIPTIAWWREIYVWRQVLDFITPESSFEDGEGDTGFVYETHCMKKWQVKDINANDVVGLYW